MEVRLGDDKRGAFNIPAADQRCCSKKSSSKMLGAWWFDNFVEASSVSSVEVRSIDSRFRAVSERVICVSFGVNNPPAIVDSRLTLRTGGILVIG